MSPITTHVLDTAKGLPAFGVPVVLKKKTNETWKEIAQGTTDVEGRISDLTKGTVDAGIYRMIFDTTTYFKNQKIATFYPYVMVVFEITDPGVHYHVPLLLSPFGYSTYRGS